MLKGTVSGRRSNPPRMSLWSIINGFKKHHDANTIQPAKSDN
jgi:hypothetical protein